LDRWNLSLEVTISSFGSMLLSLLKTMRFPSLIVFLAGMSDIGVHPIDAVGDHRDRESAEGLIMTDDAGTARATKATRPVTFYAMGDVPYSFTERKDLDLQIANLDKDVDFAIHLGDMQDHRSHCVSHIYKDVAVALNASEIPMFIIPGTVLMENNSLDALITLLTST